MLKEIKVVKDHPPLISCRCGNEDLIVEEYIYEGSGERQMPVNYVMCDCCGRKSGGSHTSAAEACVRWNNRMCR